jgi:hypothetical protein
MPAHPEAGWAGGLAFDRYDMGQARNQMINWRIWLAGLLLGCTAQQAVVVSEAAGPSEPARLTLRQGATGTLEHANITVTMLEVSDLTSAGCLGGPVGCPDHARIRVSDRNSEQELKLYTAHTEHQRKTGVNQATVFGYRITLQSVRHYEATLILEKPSR